MIIYPLPPAELDDKTLNQQIKAIAQTLCNVHHEVDGLRITLKQIPLSPERVVKHGKGIELSWDNYTSWASECLANYKHLVDMGLACCSEYIYRYSDIKCPSCHKEHSDKFFDITKPNMPCENCGQFAGSTELVRHEYESVIEFARDNVPDLPDKLDCVGLPVIDTDPDYCPTTPFPLVMPEKYYKYTSFEFTKNETFAHIDIEESYRNYYRDNLSHVATWTRREKPEWL